MKERTVVAVLPLLESVGAMARSAKRRKKERKRIVRYCNKPVQSCSATRSAVAVERRSLNNTTTMTTTISHAHGNHCSASNEITSSDWLDTVSLIASAWIAPRIPQVPHWNQQDTRSNPIKLSFYNKPITKEELHILGRSTTVLATHPVSDRGPHRYVVTPNRRVDTVDPSPKW